MKSFLRILAKAANCPQPPRRTILPGKVSANVATAERNPSWQYIYRNYPERSVSKKLRRSEPICFPNPSRRHRAIPTAKISRYPAPNGSSRERTISASPSLFFIFLIFHIMLTMFYDTHVVSNTNYALFITSSSLKSSSADAFQHAGPFSFKPGWIFHRLRDLINCSSYRTSFPGNLWHFDFCIILIQKWRRTKRREESWITKAPRGAHPGWTVIYGPNSLR